MENSYFKRNIDAVLSAWSEEKGRKPLSERVVQLIVATYLFCLCSAERSATAA